MRSAMKPRHRAALCVFLLIAGSTSAWADDAEADQTSLSELQQQRLKILEQILDVATAQFSSAQVSYEEVHNAKVELLKARLAYAETQQERIQICDEAVAEARNWNDFVEAMRKAARASPVTVLKARAYLLETEIARKKAGE